MILLAMLGVAFTAGHTVIAAKSSKRRKAGTYGPRRMFK